MFKYLKERREKKEDEKRKLEEKNAEYDKKMEEIREEHRKIEEREKEEDLFGYTLKKLEPRGRIIDRLYSGNGDHVPFFQMIFELIKILKKEIEKLKENK